MPLTDVGTIVEFQKFPERRPFLEKPVRRYVANIKAGAAGAFEKDTTRLNGRLLRLSHKPLVNPTALSELELYDREIDTAALSTAVYTWTNGITTSVTHVDVAAPQPVIDGRLRLRVVNNIVATYEGELSIFLGGVTV